MSNLSNHFLVLSPYYFFQIHSPDDTSPGEAPNQAFRGPPTQQDRAGHRATHCPEGGAR